ncbi:MAG: hypothetical protein ACI84K_000675 [Pseudohongiellaceae bacterium]
MTDIGEAVAVFNAAGENEIENYCDGKESESTSWKVRVSGLGGAEPTPARLLKSMEKHGKDIPDKALIKKIDGKWDLESCSKSIFPYQAHHLIPKKYLPTHSVCVWLTSKWTKNRKYQLTADSNYDTDHANNGYCMPFVSNTYQWKAANGNEAAQIVVAQSMMKKTGIQLHQGSHSKTNFGEEVEDIESEGYLQVAKDLLDLVSARAVIHISKCKICKGDGKKPNVQPLESIVSQMDMVSNILKLKLEANIIFVSERAFDAFIATK